MLQSVGAVQAERSLNVVWYDAVDRKHSATEAVHGSSSVDFHTAPQPAILQCRQL